MMPCGGYDLIVEAPVSIREQAGVEAYIYEHVRAHLIGRVDPEPLRVFLWGWARKFRLPPGVHAGYAHLRDHLKPHRLRFLDEDEWPARVICQRCGRFGIWRRDKQAQPVITDPANLPRMRWHPQLPIQVPHVADLPMRRRWWATDAEVDWIGYRTLEEAA